MLRRPALAVLLSAPFLAAPAFADEPERGGSVVHCSWTVRPYLEGPGGRVALTPPRYGLRSATASVTPTSDGAGWALQPAATGSPAAAVFDLSFIDTSTGQAVLHQRLALRCADDAPPAQLPPPEEAPLPASGLVLPVVTYTPPPQALAFECRWGRSSKGGCNEDPKPVAAFFTAAGAALLAGGGVGLYFSSPDGGGWQKAGRIAAYTSLGLGAAWSVTGAALWAVSAAGAAKQGPLLPAVSVSGKGASFGLTGTF
jgi:hypothetical protein